MKRDTTKRYYEIHSWVGALTAILIFIICYTGSVSVFGRPEIKIWASENIRAPLNLDPQQIELLVREKAGTVPEEFREKISIIFPGVRSAEHLLFNFEYELIHEDGSHEDRIIRIDIDPTSLEEVGRFEGDFETLLAQEKTDMADFIIQFHADLHLGSPWGLLLTGLLGLTLFVSIVTGITIHRKILKELFTFRPWRSYRLLLTDSHKVLGIWGTLFHMAIAFTGAFLGLAVVALLPAAAYVSFGGDQELLVETFLPEPSTELSHEYSEIMLADVLVDAAQGGEGEIIIATIYSGHDQNALVVLNTLAGEEMVGNTLSYRARDAELLSSETTFSPVGGISGKLFDLMFPLHFGNFGGILVKFLWAGLGLSTGILGVTGMMIWLERRINGSTGTMTKRSYQRISTFTIGSCCGILIAVASLFYSQLLLNISDQNLDYWIGNIFFGSWIITIAGAFLFASNYRALKWLITIAGSMHLLIPIANGLFTGDHIPKALMNEMWVTAGVDFTHLIYGALLIYITRLLPESRFNMDTKKSSSELLTNPETAVLTP